MAHGNAATVHRLHPELGRDAWEREVATWEEANRGKGLAPKTLTSYAHATLSLERWMVAEGHSLDPEAFTTEMARAYMAALAAEGRTPSTRVTYYVTLHLFFGWLAGQEAIPANPWAKVERPKLRAPSVPVVADDHWDALLGSITGKSFVDARDYALLRLMGDTGLRRHEVVGLLTEDVEWKTNTAWVWGKGDKLRRVRWGHETALALNVYERHRRRHALAGEVFNVGRADHPREGHPLFLGEARTGRGPLTGPAVNVMLKRRCAAAGVPTINPHRLRHTSAHLRKRMGATDDDMMAGFGWSSPAMLARYGASEREARALENYRSPEDARVARKRAGR